MFASPTWGLAEHSPAFGCRGALDPAGGPSGQRPAWVPDVCQSLHGVRLNTALHRVVEERWTLLGLHQVRSLHGEPDRCQSLAGLWLNIVLHGAVRECVTLLGVQQARALHRARDVPTLHGVWLKTALHWALGKRCLLGCS